MIVLDASVLIGHLDGRDRHHGRARELLEASDAEPLAASALTLAETLVGPARTGRLGEAEAALERLGVRELPLEEGAAAELAQLRSTTGLKLPDCCVLLTALGRAGTVAGFDADLLEAAADLGLDTLS